MSLVVDHLGVAVRSLSAARHLYDTLGLPLSAEENVPGEKVRLLMVKVGDLRIELLEATSHDSVIAKFISRRGEGLHHIGLRVPNLAHTVERLKADGVRLVSEEIKTGAGGQQYVFIHPASASGVLLELVGGAG
ncbi:MAG: methylmalonyl-CoA epimerase [Acidobacteria bacterium]|nr:methylmalonyl-CoA epimerase [Acidobacteriota bacterium]